MSGGAIYHRWHKSATIGLNRTDFWRWDGMGCSGHLQQGLAGAKCGRFDTNRTARKIRWVDSWFWPVKYSCMAVHPGRGVCTRPVASVVGRFLEAGQIFGGLAAWSWRRCITGMATLKRFSKMVGYGRSAICVKLTQRVSAELCNKYAKYRSGIMCKKYTFAGCCGYGKFDILLKFLAMPGKRQISFFCTLICRSLDITAKEKQTFSHYQNYERLLPNLWAY